MYENMVIQISSIFPRKLFRFSYINQQSKWEKLINKKEKKFYKKKKKETKEKNYTKMMLLPFLQRKEII